MALRVFKSLKDAEAEGFRTYDRSPLILVVKRPTAGIPAWELAFVQLRLTPESNK